MARTNRSSNKSKPAFNPMIDWATPAANESRESKRKKVLHLLRKVQENCGTSSTRVRKAINHCRKDYEDFEHDTGFIFGEMIAVRLDRQDYLDNYVLARVLGLGVERRKVTRGGRSVEEESWSLFLYTDLNGTNNGGCFLALHYDPNTSLDDFLSMADYKKRKARLIKQGRLTTPVNPLKLTLLQTVCLSRTDRELYWKRIGANKVDVPTIDTVPTSWKDKRSSPRLLNSTKDEGKPGFKAKAKTVFKKGASHVSIEIN